MRGRTIYPRDTLVFVVLLFVCGVWQVWSDTGEAAVKDDDFNLVEESQMMLHALVEPRRRFLGNRFLSSDEESEDSEYGGGMVSEENENEIDCSEFEDWDELPSFCQDVDNNGAQDEDNNEEGDDNDNVVVGDDEILVEGEDDDTGILGGVTDPIPTPYPTQSPVIPAIDGGVTISGENSIRFPLSIGIVKPEDLNRRRARVLLNLVVQVMGIFLDRYTPYRVDWSYGDYTVAFVDDEDRRHLDEDTFQQEDETGQNLDLDESGNGENASNGQFPNATLVSLHLSGVDVWVSPVWENWLQVTVTYTVFWTNGGPVMNQRSLDIIEHSCHEVINTTVETGKFWAELLEEDQEALFVMREGESWSQLDMAGISAISKFGEEYDTGSGTSENDVGERGEMDPSQVDRSRPFDEQLETEWGIREWFGLGVGVFTTFMTTFLAMVSAHLHSRQAQKNLWGLTEQGVGELLKVGWSYQEGCSGQLFLKVYDKGRLGYSDENSVLEGSILAGAGFEGTATTATPRSNQSPDP